MYVNYNGVLRPMGYPMPLYFFISADRKITPEQLKANLRRIVERYVTAANNENKRTTGADHLEPGPLRTKVAGDVNNAISELLKEIKIEGVAISTGADTTSSKVFNLGSYVQDMNAELNQMINDGIPL
tara:strand:- start:27 stop:410 length:384 start_codon:yes stop_codon:yes gene_type:complete